MFSGVAEVRGALSEVGGPGPLANEFFSWGPFGAPYPWKSLVVRQRRPVKN